MSKGTPKYWYNQYWIQSIHEEGIETVAKVNAHDPPVWGSCNGEEKTVNIKQKHSWYYCWIPKISMTIKSGVPSVDSESIRLFVREKEDSDEFRAQVEIASISGRNRLIACRTYDIGDAILFLSQAEENNDILFLGGAIARKSKKPDQCNAYLTKGRLLRCTRPIKEGDEIIRCVTNEDSMPYFQYFERIDMMVISRKGQMVGRISSDGADRRESIVVNYPNGEYEVADIHSGLGFVYTD